MTYNLLKFHIFQKFQQFKTFIILLLIVTSTIIIINIYDKFKKEQFKNLENIIQNIYLQKTLQSLSKSLEPRFEKVNYIINSGDNLNEILNELDLNKTERNKLLNFISNNKIKLKLYQNQKIIFEIDNLDSRKITKITIPINKKKDLIISDSKESGFKFVELTKELTLNKVYKENIIKNSLYKSAI